MELGRRAFIVGSAGVMGAAALGVVGLGALVESGVLPGKSTLDEALGRCGDALDPPLIEPGPVLTGSFISGAMNDASIGWTIAYPPGSSPGDPLPVCLFLHGRGGSHIDLVDGMHLPEFLAEAVEVDGVPPFAIASVDGGDATNWHLRSNGDDPPAMIEDEFLPLLRSQGLETNRLAIWGVSLGGTGALYLATLPNFDPVAVVAASPALWRESTEWQSGAYDDAADFESNNLWNRRDLLAGTELRIDCGDSDPFATRVRQFREGLVPIPTGAITSGCHDGRFWSRQTPAQIEFIGTALATR